MNEETTSDTLVASVRVIEPEQQQQHTTQQKEEENEIHNARLIN